MNFTVLDYSIVAAYLIGVTLAGARLARQQHSLRDYFLGGKQMSWWAVGISMVASETSTLTFVSIPGLAYVGNMHFLQLAFGYLIGRLLVAHYFIPAFFRNDLETAYDFLGKRFGILLRRLVSSVFLLTRVLASGVRLFATAIPVHLVTGMGYRNCILVIGLFTLVYTSLGGLKAVVAMDVVQLGIYLGAALISGLLILNRLPHGWTDVAGYAVQTGSNKFAIFNLEWGPSVGQFFSLPYTLAGGLIGGAFLSMASHGTDQLLVQRLLGCKSSHDSQRALVLDALLIILQFAFFLLLGLCLYAYYGGKPISDLGLQSSDEVFPKFIVENLPSGLAGLVVAGVLASAMGALSSAMTSLASSSYLDLYQGLLQGRPFEADKGVAESRWFTLFWGILLIGGATIFENTRAPVVVLGLQIASVTYGGMLGVFLLGIFFPLAELKDAMIGFVIGIASTAVVLKYTVLAFTWHCAFGCLVTLTAALFTHLFRGRAGGKFS
ncbi:MAG: sodium:solute symporter [Terriglobia bacterium]